MRRGWTAAVILFTAFLWAGWFAQDAAVVAQTIEGRLAKIDKPPMSPLLGIAFPGPLKAYPVIADSGFGVVRLSAAWKHLEPSRGRFDWDGFDKRIRTMQQLGLEPFVTLESNAGWAVRPNSSRLTNGTPKDMRDWQRFVHAVVERYDHDGDRDAPGLTRPVRYYQVANEWLGAENSAGGWLGTTDELIQFINLSHDTAKKASSKTIFVQGGIASGQADRLVLYEKGLECQRQPNLKQCPRVKKEIGGKANYVRNQGEKATRVYQETRYDVADLHLYGPLENDIPKIQTMKRMTGNRPILSSECGGPSLIKRGDVYRPEDHFMAVLGRNLTALSEGLSFCLWFRLVEGRGSSKINAKVPLVASNREPKPGYYAYKLLAVLLEGAERVERRGGNTFVIHRKGSGPLMVAWKSKNDKTDGQITLAAEVSGEVLRITDLAKAIYAIEAAPGGRASLPISELPIVAGKELPKALRPSR